MATIRLKYPKNLGRGPAPCGLWPEDLGPSIKKQELFREQAVLQFRLRQPAQPGGDGRQSVGTWCSRGPETPAYYGAAYGRVREISQKAKPTSILYPDAEKAKLSDTGK